MTTYGTFDIDSVPAPSDCELEHVLELEHPSEPDCETDYRLANEASGCWVRVHTIAVHIFKERSGEGVTVHLYPAGQACVEPLDVCYAEYPEEVV